MINLKLLNKIKTFKVMDAVKLLGRIIIIFIDTMIKINWRKYAISNAGLRTKKIGYFVKFFSYVSMLKNEK